MNKLEGLLLYALENRKTVIEKYYFNNNQNSIACREAEHRYINLFNYLRAENYEIPSEYNMLYARLKHGKKKMEG